MFDIRQATIADVEPALDAVTAAFAGDPLMRYFFGDADRTPRMRQFFSILLRMRLELGMPANLLLAGEKLQGLAMGYDSTRPAWPALFLDEWSQLEASVPGLADRFAAYDAISETHVPAESHYYLGVIGLAPALQGKGAGRALLEHFCALSQADARSNGVYLETSSPASLQFYLRNGFQLRGEDQLHDIRLWCLYGET